MAATRRSGGTAAACAKVLRDTCIEVETGHRWFHQKKFLQLVGGDAKAVAKLFSGNDLASGAGQVVVRRHQYHVKGYPFWCYTTMPKEYREEEEEDCDGPKRRSSVKEKKVKPTYKWPRVPYAYEIHDVDTWAPESTKRAAPPLSPHRAPPPAKKYDADYDDVESEDEAAVLLPRNQTTGELRLEIMELKSQLSKHVNLEKRNHALESMVSDLRNKLKDKDAPRDFTAEAARRDAQEARHGKPKRRSKPWRERLLEVNRAIKHGFVARFRPRVIADLVAASSDYMRSVLSTRGAASPSARSRRPSLRRRATRRARRTPS
jgi:hypothetical protein